MPHLTALIEPRGPVLQVIVAATTARRKALQDAGQPVPNPVTASLLVDTGASMSCICKTVIQKLGLTPTGSIGMLTPSTGGAAAQAATYDVDIMMPAQSTFKHLAAIPVVESDFAAQGIHGLIGRDILKEFRMTYSGPDQLVLLSY